MRRAFALCALGADMDLSPPEGQPPIRTSSQPFAGWIQFARGLGNALFVALERRDCLAAIHLLQSRQTDRPTATTIRDKLLPIASTVGTHALARPVCEKTRRVAEVASETAATRKIAFHALTCDARGAISFETDTASERASATPRR